MIKGGVAQYDHVHFTAQGYKMLGAALYRDVMGQYDVFLKARSELAVTASAEAGQ